MPSMVLSLFFLLVLGHFVADYPLQTDFVAKFKCRKNSLEAVPWFYVMAGHAATHALVVVVLTGSPLLGLCELVAHYLIDVAKCESWTGIHTDQLFHVACKAVWALLAVYVLA